MEPVQTADTGNTGETGPIQRPRVHLPEWLVGLGGLAVLGGLFLPWAGDQSAVESLSVLKLLVLLGGLAAVAVPIVVASSAKTDLPVVWETFLSTFMILILLLLTIRLVWPPAAGLESGFFTVAAGSLLLTVAGWFSVAREY